MSPHKIPPIDPDRHDSDVNIPKTMKKTAIGWIVVGVLGLTCYAFLALGDTHYETKEQAKIDRQQCDTQYGMLVNRIQQLTDIINLQDKKIDRLQFTIDYNQSHDNRAQSPKQKEQNP